MKLYRIDEVAELFGVSVITVRRLLRAGDLPYVRIGGQNRIRDSDVAEYIATHVSAKPRARRR